MMTREELFKKNFPEYCTEKGVCLSPYYDVFEAGVEIATAELNKVIQSLTKENAELKARECWKSCEYASPKSEWIVQHIKDVKQFAQAKEIIKNLLDVAKFYNKHRDKGAIMDITPIYDAEQFINSEVEK